MSDREALEAALHYFGIGSPFGVHPHFASVLAAARERLAQLPELVDDPECGDCDHLPRKVYPQETVELIAKVLYTMDASWIDQQRNPWPLLVKAQRKVYEAKAVAVLDALGETP